MKLYQVFDNHFLLFLLLTFFFSLNSNYSLSYAQTNSNYFYVDKDAVGNNNGTSWSNAWTSFSIINWSLVQPGDTVWVSGGVTSKSYTDNLSPSKSGTYSKYVVIAKSKTAGHSGKVIMNGNVSFNNASCVEVNGFSFLTGGGRVEYKYGGTSTTSPRYHLRVKNCDFYIAQYAAIFMQYHPRYVEIIDNYFEQDPNTAEQTDCIFIRGDADTGNPFADSVIVRGNTFVNNNQNPTPHSDGLQLLLVKNIWYENNKSYLANNKTAYTQMFYGNWIEGKVFISNNLFYISSPALSPFIYIHGYSSALDSVILYNNTIVASTGSANRTPFFAVLPSGVSAGRLVLRNNIFVNQESPAGAFEISDMLTTSSNNNIFYAPGGNGVVKYLGSVKSWSQWRALGFDGQGYNVKPAFVNFDWNYSKDPSVYLNYDFSLVNGTTGVDNGVDLGARWNEALNNVTRTGNWDIGAFEFADGTINDITPPQVVSASLVNSTTLVINFSEVLNSSTAQNKNNYVISNGIVISSAALSGTKVTLTTSAHETGSYLVTVNNVTDLASNVINPNNNTASYSFSPGDLTQPNLLNAVINNSTTLVLSFSEPLTSNSAQNINNYSVNNGVNVTAASLSGSQVTLTTSAHNSGSYTVTVNNVTDLAGNTISPSNNTASYSYSEVDVAPPILLSVTLLDSVSLELTFSEELDGNSSQVANNYSISNNVNVQSAQLSISQHKVILFTSVHSSGLEYLVVVNNVTDLAGNPISQSNNSANYNYIFDNIPPDVSNLSVTNIKSITLNFSEKINPIKANDKTNYSVSNNVVISSAQILPDSMSVLLKTSSQQRDRDYTLTIRNISDKVGNNISPNPKQVYYRLPKKGKGTLIQSPIEKAIANSWDQNYLPEKTIDGEGMINSDSRWKSNKIMPDTINYDMGKVSTVDLLSVSFYKWESNRKYKFSVYSSKDSISWESVLNSVWSDSSEWTEIEFDSTQARYIKLVLLESNQSPWASIWEVELFGHSETNENNNEIPTTFSLFQNYPNPFNPKTTIEYSVSKKSNITLKIFDMLGSEVETLIDDEVNEGKYTVDFDATGLTSGIYFYRLQSETNIETKKMILLK